MSQKSDDSIERFFRKGVVQQDKTFMERDWQSMEKMLDDEAMSAASASAAKSKIAAKVIVGVVMISFLFLIGVEREIPQNTVQMQAAVGSVGPRLGVKNGNPAADLHSSADRNTPEVVDQRSSHSQTRALKKAAGIPGQPREAKKIRKTTDISLSANVNPPSSLIQGNPTEKNSTADSPNISLSKPTEDRSDANIADGMSTELGGTQALNEVKSEVEVTEIAGSDTDNQSTTVIEEKPFEEKDQQNKRTPKFNVTAFISPDFSTTSLTRYSKPSGAFGVLIGYRITPRFVVMAGATKSLKRYEGYGSEYTPPEGYWQSRTNGIIPDEVEGKCGIIEIPLMVQFDVIQRAKSRMFVSGGVSSYFMRSEHYQYTFNEPNPGAANSWTAREPTDYLFKIGHVSAGYDRLIGKKFTIGIEPFLKVPFEGIGWTDISLYSTGAYLNLRYNILNIQ